MKYKSSKNRLLVRFENNSCKISKGNKTNSINTKYLNYYKLNSIWICQRIYLKNINKYNSHCCI